jgi:hypothetical protein
MEQNLGVFTTKQIARGDEPVLHVSHDQDGDWQFLPFTTPNDKDASIIHIGHLLERDSSLSEVMDLPLGWHAYRKEIGDAWTREKCSDAD